MPTGGGVTSGRGVGRIVGGATVGIPVVRKREVGGGEQRKWSVERRKVTSPFARASRNIRSSLPRTDVPQMGLKRNSNFQGFFSPKDQLIIQITANYWGGRQQSRTKFEQSRTSPLEKKIQSQCCVSFSLGPQGNTCPLTPWAQSSGTRGWDYILN